MNDKLTGFRTLILTALGVLLGNVDTINGAIQDIVAIIGTQLSEGGAVATLVTALVSIKATITDAVPKMRGTLNK